MPRIARWPLRIAPYDDEILSSFLVRAAHRHGQLPYSFCSFWWPGRAVWNRDLDRGEDAAWLQDIAHRARLAPERIRASTLQEPRNRFGVGSGDTPLILSAGIFHRTRTAHAHQFCPACVRKAEYYRRAWRFSFVVSCPDCGTALCDACSHCAAPVVPHRSHRIGACHVCLLPLSGSKRHQTAVISPTVMALQNALMAQLGGVPGTTVGPWTTDAMFMGVRALVTVSRHHDVLPALRRVLGLDAHNPAAVGTARFERMRLSERVPILETVACWLTNWPQTFFVSAGATGLTQRSFRRLAQPGSLADEISRLPEGFARDRTYVPLLQDRAIKRLRRRDPDGYRRVRGARLLDATTPRT